MSARNNQDVWGEQGLYWSLPPPALLAARPDYYEMDDEEERERLMDQHMDDKFCDGAEITILKYRICYCYTGISPERHAAPPPLQVQATAANGQYITHRDIKTALERLRYCNHHFLERIWHVEGNIYQASFGS